METAWILQNRKKSVRYSFIVNFLVAVLTTSNNARVSYTFWKDLLIYFQKDQGMDATVANTLTMYFEVICNMLLKTIKYGRLIIKPLKSFNHCRADSDY